MVAEEKKRKRVAGPEQAGGTESSQSVPGGR
jgi:hypothetical protein